MIRFTKSHPPTTDHLRPGMPNFFWYSNSLASDHVCGGYAGSSWYFSISVALSRAFYGILCHGQVQTTTSNIIKRRFASFQAAPRSHSSRICLAYSVVLQPGPLAHDSIDLESESRCQTAAYCVFFVYSVTFQQKNWYSFCPMLDLQFSSGYWKNWIWLRTWQAMTCRRRRIFVPGPGKWWP